MTAFLEALDIALDTNRRVFYDESTATIRTAPDNFRLCRLQLNGRWYADPDTESGIDATAVHSAIQHADYSDGYELADALEDTFWADIVTISAIKSGVPLHSIRDYLDYLENTNHAVFA